MCASKQSLLRARNEDAACRQEAQLGHLSIWLRRWPTVDDKIRQLKKSKGMARARAITSAQKAA